ncbi:MAG: Lrp/AsnC family transcriptional regulator [Bacteroidaceae bacterium]|nr:Lrp/AsnC family transcriptional regulator [Bacteroidaceae bacterium]MDE5999622.1 Lrp/AsnC family transcriptional regulator [Bacteroidaceae bacterium]MDE6720574.1 Lrp/AsnC family transcriptional regulator [Bacteroidaceae bacterium]
METYTHELDATDLQILRILQANSRLTTKELAQQIHLSITPTYERQRRLERMGYIKGYVAVLDAYKMERGFMVFCNISMKQINKVIASEFRNAVGQWNEVTECYNVSGDGDYLLKVCVSSMQKYQQFILDKLGDFPYISQVRSFFVMDTLKLTYGFPM